MSLREPTSDELLASYRDSLNRLRLAESSWLASDRQRGIKSMAFLTAEIEKIQRMEGKNK